MSVAFRRESDEEHLEPKFELPLPAGPNLVTARGLKLIGDKIAELEVAIGRAADADPLKRELRYWRTRAATAELAPPPPPGQVGIGSVVTFTLAGRTRVLTVVGADEADPAGDRIGFAAPLAQALLGGEVGERVDFGGKPEAIEIVAVEEAG